MGTPRRRRWPTAANRAHLDVSSPNEAGGEGRLLRRAIKRPGCKAAFSGAHRLRQNHAGLRDRQRHRHAFEKLNAVTAACGRA